MKEEQLVNETFKNPFNMDQYKLFLSELLNTPITKQKNVINYIGKEYADYVSSVNELGYFRDQNNSYIYIYTVELKKESSIYKARTMQRNLIAKLLKTNSKDNALVAFYEKDNPDWRFSFVNREYELTEKGVSEKLSPAKRYSFLVGPNEPNHTCREQFVSRIIQENITVEEIKEAFNIENVTKEFFKEYRQLFIKLDKSLKNLVKKDELIAKEFEEKNIQTEDFAKKIMGQIVFLYFIQKKGWLGVDKEKEFGTGPKNFMRRLYNKEYINYENFFNDVLEPLFYKGLSEDVTDYHYELFNCKVPFLNGGLFENINGYNWEDTDILIDNKIFEEILDTFDTYNFTIKEDEPLDKEVAVDPEMLGKVFENLLTSIERKKNGTFYTPRNIVHFMCQQTIIEYLKTNTSINEDDLREFIENGYLTIDSIIKNHNEKLKYNGKTFTKITLPNSIQENANQLDYLLQNVKVVDPAVGSGAFPVGMMYELVNARYILNLIADNPIDLYELKRETIENSLYGVDLSYSATDITKLRFWLSLIVDEEIIEPLPNLDNKIIAGNSLLDTFHGIKIYDKSKIEKNQTGQLSLFESYDAINKFKKMEQYKHEFFNEKSPNKKKELKKQINEMKWKFIESSITNSIASDEKSLLKELNEIKAMNSKPFLVWELEFSEIFQTENPGFDIVIGNPPYVKETKKNAEIFDLYKNSPYYKAKMDLWYFFACNGIDLLKRNGNLCFIAPNNWTTNDGASKLRDKIIDDSKINFYVDFGNFHVFESANIQTMIISLNKTNNNDVYSLRYSLLKNEDSDINHINNVLSQNNIFYLNNNTSNNYEKYISTIDKKQVKGEYIKFLDKNVSNIIDRLCIDKDYVHYLNKNEVSQGIVAPQDKLNKKNKDSFSRNEDIGAGIFVLSNDELNNLHLTSDEFKLIKPFYTSNEIKRFFCISENKEWLIYTKSEINEMINKYPNIKSHLDNFQELITSSNKPYGLHRSRKEYYFKGEKIISMRKCIIPTFSYVDYDSYVSQTFILIKKEDVSLKYLTGLLNSNVTQFILKFKGKLQGNNYQVDQNPLYKIPLIYGKNLKLENKITDIVEHIIDEKDEKKYIKRLNELVYELYDLNDKDIMIIENSI